MGGTGAARALRWSCRGSPGVAPLLGYGTPRGGSEDPGTGSGRGVFGGSRRRSVELSGASLLPSHQIWSLCGFGMGEAVVTPVTPGDPGPDVTPGMRHSWGCQGARASPGARGHEGVRRLHPMGMLPWGCCLLGTPVPRWMGTPPVLSRAPGAERGRTRWAAHPARGCQDLRERLVTLASPCREA